MLTKPKLVLTKDTFSIDFDRSTIRLIFTSCSLSTDLHVRLKVAKVIGFTNQFRNFTVAFR